MKLRNYLAGMLVALAMTSFFSKDALSQDTSNVYTDVNEYRSAMKDYNKASSEVDELNKKVASYAGPDYDKLANKYGTGTLEDIDRYINIRLPDSPCERLGASTDRFLNPTGKPMILNFFGGKFTDGSGNYIREIKKGDLEDGTMRNYMLTSDDLEGCDKDELIGRVIREFQNVFREFEIEHGHEVEFVYMIDKFQDYDYEYKPHFGKPLSPEYLESLKRRNRSGNVSVWNDARSNKGTETTENLNLHKDSYFMLRPRVSDMDNVLGIILPYDPYMFSFHSFDPYIYGGKEPMMDGFEIVTKCDYKNMNEDRQEELVGDEKLAEVLRNICNAQCE